MTSYDFDLIVIGAGSGGVRMSRTSAAMGAEVAIIENMRTGGTCVMRGCVPKKLLVYGSTFSDAFKDSKGFGWTSKPASFSWPDLIKAKDEELARLEIVYNKLLRSSGVAQFKGTGRILNPHLVAVDAKEYSAKYIVIATGGWPYLPNIPGIEHAITSNEALDLETLPKSIVIVGGGFIAAEFAGIFNALETRVHQIIRGPNILRGFDQSVQKSLEQEMKKKGIIIQRNSNVTNIEKMDDGHFNISLDSGKMIETDTIMYATGRNPNIENLGVTEVGIEVNKKGAIVVDEYSRTSVSNIYAIGDVTDRVNLTPVALAEGMALAKTLFGQSPASINYKNIPSAVFSQPPIGTVGLTEEEARQSYSIDIYLSSFIPMKHSLSKRKEYSMMKLIVDSKTDLVLGRHMMGEDAPEIIQGMAIAIKCGATKAQFDNTIGIHPTSAEEFVTMRDKLRQL